MLKINAIKLDIVTIDGSFGYEQSFGNGLNIIRGNNSSGKSSLFQAILYALGLEELLGGKNEKTMQSVLKDMVEFPDGMFHKILQSYVYLEIMNDEIVTIKRPIVSPSESPKLIDVFFGALLSGENKSLKKQAMFIHDKGGASDNTFGFHLFLANFLGWEMPEVTNVTGQKTHLYIQQIAPAFFIEQKSGWSDFFATMPYYGIKQATSRVIEFLLNMDIFENQKKKQEINYIEETLREQWKNIYFQADNIARDTRFTLQGLTEKPTIINNIDEVCLIKDTEFSSIDIEQDLLAIKQEYSNLIAVEIKTVGENAEIIETKLKTLQNTHNLKSLQYDMISSELSISEQQLERYEEQLKEIETDLLKNRNALKVVKLGGEIGSHVSASICPTCHQQIEDTLLPHDIQQVPMRLEDNIKYLESEQKMIGKYIEGQRNLLSDKQHRLNLLRDELSDLRVNIRSLKNDLTADNRMPSVAEIERRLNLKKKMEFFGKKIEEFEDLKKQIWGLSNEYKTILSKKKNLSNEYSARDKKKIDDFNLSFTNALEAFEYESKPVNTIKISNENYLPLTQLDTGEIYNIRFDSSASDFIRCLWGYYIALMQTSIKHQGNHPNLLMFDEPKQQDMSEEGFRVFLKTLSEFPIGQIFVFASFENKDESFLSVTKGIRFNLVRIDNKLIKALS